MNNTDIIRNALLANKKRLANEGYISPAEQADSLEQARQTFKKENMPNAVKTCKLIKSFK